MPNVQVPDALAQCSKCPEVVELEIRGYTALQDLIYHCKQLEHEWLCPLCEDIEAARDKGLTTHPDDDE